MNNTYIDGNYYLNYSLNCLNICLNPNINNYSLDYMFSLFYGANIEFVSAAFLLNNTLNFDNLKLDIFMNVVYQNNKYYIYDCYNNYDELEYYDTESNMYYLNSRYYNSLICRFITSDSYEYIDINNKNSYNLYVYCNNNPVMYADPDGTFGVSALLIGALVGAASYTASEVISAGIHGEWTWSWEMFFGSVVGGAIGGAIGFIPGIGAAIPSFISGISSQSIGMVTQNLTGSANYSFNEFITSTIFSGVTSALFSGLSKTIKVKGISSGKGSYSAISKQIFTKLNSGTISRISAKTFSKISFNSFILSTYKMVFDAFFYENVYEIEWKY